MPPAHPRLRRQLVASLMYSTHGFARDTTLKILIADETHPERLVHFLNSLLRLEGANQIKTATLQGTEQEVIFGFERKIVFDVLCKSESGEPIIVEFQRDGDQGFKDRMLY